MARPWIELLIARRYPLIAALSITAIVAYLILHFGGDVAEDVANWPLYVALALGGVPIVAELVIKILKRDFGSDLLAGISIVASVLLGQYLAGTLVVLMLSGGEAIEGYAVRSAASVLHALARRMPLVAHRRRNSHVEDVPLEQIAVDDALVVFPHEICPVDGEVLEGHSVMDESYLTGEPYRMSKTPGATVLSGSINGDAALVIRATRRAVDSRYAQIMRRDAGIGTKAAAHSEVGRSIGRLVHAVGSGDCGGRRSHHTRSNTFSGGVGGRYALPIIDCDSGGDHRQHFAVGAARHHRARSGSAGAGRYLPDCNF